SIAATPRWCQVSSIHFDNLGTTTYGGPLTSSGTSTSLFHSHSLPTHCAMPAPDRRCDHFLLHLIRALPWEYRHRMHRILHSRESGRQNLLLHCLPCFVQQTYFSMK